MNNTEGRKIQKQHCEGGAKDMSLWSFFVKYISPKQRVCLPKCVAFANPKHFILSTQFKVTLPDFVSKQIRATKREQTVYNTTSLQGFDGSGGVTAKRTTTMPLVSVPLLQTFHLAACIQTALRL